MAPSVTGAGRVTGCASASSQTQPLPTYLVAFVVGDMKVETATRDGRTMRMFHRENDAAKLARNRDALFDLHAKSLEALERYTGIPYPFGKFDFVLVPAFQPGAMEHAGNIAYNAETVLLDESATQEAAAGARPRYRARDRPHVVRQPGHDALVRRRLDQGGLRQLHRGQGHRTAVPAGAARPAVLPAQPLDGLTRSTARRARTRSASHWTTSARRAACTAPIVYNKSPVVMRQLEALLGETAFRDGVRSYLRRHAFGNATWDDLIAALAGRTKLDLKQWSQMWIDEPGRPLIRTDLEIDDGRVQRLALQQQRPPGTQSSVATATARHGRAVARHPRRIVVELTGREVELTRSLDGCVPDYVLAGGEGWGYGDFELDARSQTYLLTAPARHRRPAGPGRRLVRAVGRHARRAVGAEPVVRHGHAEPARGARRATHRRMARRS